MKTNEAIDRLLMPNDDDKPEIRWWLAGGSHTDDTLLESLEEIKRMGFAGIEILTMAEKAIDGQKFGWDSCAWRLSTELLLEKATECGMSFSFTSGPNWQPAVPGIDLDGPAAAQELNFNCVVLEPDQLYDGELMPYDLSQDVDPMSKSAAPERKQHLIKVVAAKLAVRNNDAAIDLSSHRKAGLFPMPGNEYKTVYLTEDSAKDLTPLLKNDQLVWRAPADGRYAVFSFWIHSTAQRADASFSPAYVINHLDKAGFEAQKEYWEKGLFTPKMRELIKLNGKVNFFQDSLEIRTSQLSGLFWSFDFIEEFIRRRGYDLTPYLPMVIQYGIGFVQRWITHEDNRARFLYEGWEEKRKKLMADVYQTQTELYMENYLTPIRKWLNSLGIQLRSQTAYGFPTVCFEISQPISCVDIHETETLEMADEIDYFRLQSGAVHLTGKNIFSAETGATNGGAYYLNMQHYLQKIHRLFAGGINRIIIHGYAAQYGPEEAIQWPGYEALYFDTSERWGARQPYGAFVNQLTGYITRMQHVLREGAVKIDVGILNLSYTCVNMDFWYGSVSDWQNKTSEVFAWNDRGLNDAGYTYEFFAPQYLEDDKIPCENGLFDAGRTDYQALIVCQEEIPLSAARALKKIAKKGMPIVVIGKKSFRTAFLKDDQQELERIMLELIALPNVKVADAQSGAVESLKELGVFPRTAMVLPSKMVTLYRDTPEYTVLYVFNPEKAAINATISCIGEKVPRIYNAWEGVVENVLDHEWTGHRTLINISLQAGEAKILLLKKEANKTDMIRQYTERILPEIKPANWKLTVERWTPGEKVARLDERCGEKLHEVCVSTQKSTITVMLDQLCSWKDIPEIGPGVSGIGVYQTTFVVDGLEDGYGAYLNLFELNGPVEIELNGKKLPQCDLVVPKIDIGGYIRGGINELQIRTASTLCNQLIAQGRIKPGRTILKDVKTVVSDYGLKKVMIVPYIRKERAW